MKSTRPHHLYRTLSFSLSSLSLFLLLALVPFPLSPIVLSDHPASSSLLRYSRSLSHPTNHPSRALAPLECYRVAQCLTCTPAAPSSSFLPCSSTFRRVLKIARKKRRKLALISLAFFRALEKVGRSSYALAPSFLGNRLLRGDTAASSLQLSALLFVQTMNEKEIVLISKN